MGSNNPNLSYQRIHKSGRPRKAVVDGKQQCAICLEWKDLETEYGKNKITANGYESRCKKCNTARGQKQRGKDVSSFLKNACYIHKKGKFGRMSDRRKLLQATSCVTHEMLLDMWERQDGKCAVTGVPMTTITAAGGVLTNVSIDRIDSDFGYAPDNIRLVCKAVNYMKCAMSDKEMIQWAALILNGPLANK